MNAEGLYEYIVVIHLVYQRKGLVDENIVIVDVHDNIYGPYRELMFSILLRLSKELWKVVVLYFNKLTSLIMVANILKLWRHKRKNCLEIADAFGTN